MDIDFEKCEWESLTYVEKNRSLFFKQKRLLDMFLERNAISKTQYEKSLYDMTIKMKTNIEANKT